MFLLRKWYLDCVTARGDVFIGYSARLRWGVVRARYTSTLVAPAAGPVVEKATILPAGSPVPSPRGLRWRCRRLGLAGAWHPRATAIGQALLRDGGAAPGSGGAGEAEAARIEWACMQPAAAARVYVAGTTLPGLGYAELLALAIEPWRLPFHTLHWGRFVAPGTSLVWIVWEGDAVVARPARAASGPAAEVTGGADASGAVATARVAEAGARTGSSRTTRFLYLDSRPAELTEFAPDWLATADGVVLELARERVLRSGFIVSTHLRALPCVAARVPAPFLAAREEKWLSHAVLQRPGVAPVLGWAIHEIVNLR